MLLRSLRLVNVIRSSCFGVQLIDVYFDVLAFEHLRLQSRFDSHSLFGFTKCCLELCRHYLMSRDLRVVEPFHRFDCSLCL